MSVVEDDAFTRTDDEVARRVGKDQLAMEDSVDDVEADVWLVVLCGLCPSKTNALEGREKVSSESGKDGFRQESTTSEA